jgi:hypothetical protein
MSFELLKTSLFVQGPATSLAVSRSAFACSYFIMSSSSSGKALDSGITLTLAPHSDCVYLDECVDGQVITHSQTLRRQAVPSEGGPFSLVFDGDFGVLVSDEGDEVILLEDFLSRHLYFTDDGLMYVVDTTTSSDGEPAQWCLTHKMQQFGASVAKIKNLDGSELSLPIFIMDWPRGGFRVQWQIHAFYKEFGLTSFKGEPSKWVYASLPAWQDRLVKMGLSGHFVMSQHNCTRTEALTSTTKCLPHSGMTTMAMLILMPRWGGCDARRGGFRDHGPRAKALELCKLVIRGAHSHPFTIELCLDKDWVFRWPRPSSDCSTLKLRVARDGMVDVSLWRDNVADGHEFGDIEFITEMEWYGIIDEHVDGDGKISLETFIMLPSLLLDDGFTPVWAQIVWQVAVRLEMHIVGTRGPDQARDQFVYKEELAMSADWTSRAVDRTCMLHRASSKHATRGERFIGIALDKVGGCRSLDLQNAFAVMPSNVAFELVPQVMEYMFNYPFLY